MNDKTKSQTEYEMIFYLTQSSIQCTLCRVAVPVSIAIQCNTATVLQHNMCMHAVPRTRPDSPGGFVMPRCTQLTCAPKQREAVSVPAEITRIHTNIVSQPS